MEIKFKWHRMARYKINSRTRNSVLSNVRWYCICIILCWKAHQGKYIQSFISLCLILTSSKMFHSFTCWARDKVRLQGLSFELLLGLSSCWNTDYSIFSQYNLRKTISHVFIARSIFVKSVRLISFLQSCCLILNLKRVSIFWK